MENKNQGMLKLPVILLLFRLMLFASSPLEVIPGYGDYWNFYYQAGQGIPFIKYWTEFPPIFPMLSHLLYIISGGREEAFYYALAIFLSVLQAFAIWLFLKILAYLRPNEDPSNRGWVYLILTAGLFYSWSYFDTLAVCFMLLGLYLLLKKRDSGAALAIAAGALTKWFPLLIIPAIWKIRKPKRAWIIIGTSLFIILLVWVSLYFINPSFTSASLRSQVNKGSWETIWALFDGNLATGNFSSEINRLDADSVSIQTGNPAKLPPLLTLLVFGGMGLILLVNSRPNEERWLIDFVGLTLVIFFIWSPGYSPQWVLYLLPIILISLPGRESILFAAVLVLINLLEWPVLLSRGMFWSLYCLVPLRTFLLVLLGWRFYQATSDRPGLEDGALRAN